MGNILAWVYFVNFVFLANHEIDAAFWKEWDLFRLPGGLNGYLLFNFLVTPLFAYGLILVFWQTTGGVIFSLIMSFTGIFTFGIHTYFIKKGRDEFNVPMSLFILRGILIVSLIQGLVAIYILDIFPK
ncbi:MAG: DUF6713 family protein [bacterium]